MDIRVNKKGFYRLAKRIFTDFSEEKDGYPIEVPIANHHIYINKVQCFLDEDVKHYFSFNSYGQMSIEREINGVKENHIIFNLSDVSEIDFLAESFYTKVNPKTGKHYNEFFRFQFE